jgi:hypothetical protein
MAQQSDYPNPIVPPQAMRVVYLAAMRAIERGKGMPEETLVPVTLSVAQWQVVTAAMRASQLGQG